jgi:hypothetical protein
MVVILLIIIIIIIIIIIVVVVVVILILILIIIIIITTITVVVASLINSHFLIQQVPTTAGTGSEVTSISIVTTGEGEKKGVVAQELYADAAVLDGELTFGLPPSKKED